MPADRIGTARTITSTALSTEPYVQEVLSWLPEDNHQLSMESVAGDQIPADNGKEPQLQAGPSDKSRILLADDNTNMRRFIERLLVQSNYEVEPVPDGLAALRAARARTPDLG